MNRRLVLPILTLSLACLCCSGRGANVAMYPEDRMALGDKHFSEGNYTEAIIQYEKLLSEFPKQEIAVLARYNLARSRMELGEYDLAIDEFEDFIESYPRSELADDSMYMIAISYLRQSPRAERDQGKTEEAIDELRLLLREYPDTDLRDAALQKIAEARSKLAEKEYLSGELYLKLGDYRSARIYFDYVISEYSDTPWAGLALLGKGLAFERENQRDQAIEIYRDVITTFPEDRASEKAAERLKELGGAIETEARTSSQE